MRPWLYRRTRLLNVLHWMRLSEPHSQMNQIERACLAFHAQGKSKAVEIGTYMGVSAQIIAQSMSDNGKLYCVDPFLDMKGNYSIGFAMAERLLKRARLLDKIIFVRGFSTDPVIKAQLPNDLDFMLVDGDHSFEGLMNDWGLVRSLLKPSGIVCLHDTIIPAEEPYRVFGSVQYYNDVISKDSNFEVLERCYSMTVLRRLAK